MILDRKNIGQYLGTLRPKTFLPKPWENLKTSCNLTTFPPNHCYDIDMEENPLHWTSLTKRIWGQHGVILAGGSLVDLHLKKFPRDLDLYFTDAEAVTMVVFAAYQAGYTLTEEAMEDINKGVHQIVLKHPSHTMYPDLNIVTHQFYENAQHVISRFDLDICQIALEAGTGIYAQGWDWRFHEKKFKFNVIHSMIATQKRVFKYIDKGFKFVESTRYEVVDNATKYY